MTAQVPEWHARPTGRKPRFLAEIYLCFTRISSDLMHFCETFQFGRVTFSVKNPFPQKNFQLALITKCNGVICTGNGLLSCLFLDSFICPHSEVCRHPSVPAIYSGRVLSAQAFECHIDGLGFFLY